MLGKGERGSHPIEKGTSICSGDAQGWGGDGSLWVTEGSVASFGVWPRWDAVQVSLDETSSVTFYSLRADPVPPAGRGSGGLWGALFTIFPSAARLRGQVPGSGGRLIGPWFGLSFTLPLPSLESSELSEPHWLSGAGSGQVSASSLCLSLEGPCGAPCVLSCLMFSVCRTDGAVGPSQ